MNNIKAQPVLFRLTVPQITYTVSILPAFATLFCVIWSVLYNFEASTRTHCRVYNFLPSVSSSISSYTPQKYVWRVCIALHCAPRILLAMSYYTFHTSVHIGKYNELFKGLAAVNSLLHILEISALVMLSYVSSEENYAIHESMFIVFMASGLVYMLLTCLLFAFGRTSQGRQLSHQEKKSLNYKVYLFMFNISIFLLSIYFFFRHNNHCEPGAYSYFAVCEYLVIMTNIGFHCSAVIDFKQQSVIVLPFYAQDVSTNYKHS